MSFVDSIAVKILDSESVLFGRGNRLFIQTGSGIQNVNKLRPYDKLHRISTRTITKASIQIACAAGREVLFGLIVDNDFCDCFLTKFNDWISSVKILADGKVAVLTAHNFLGLVEVSKGESKILKKVQCNENSTLYCSIIHNGSWENLIIFGGTALGELVVWRSSDGRILNRQFLHNGVIFCIDFDGSHLLTSSDDRSIKLFTVGSMDDFKLLEDKQLFGHTSRVFVCKIINYRGQIALISAGEDSNLCLWSVRGDLIMKKNVSSSGILWSVDFDSINEVVVSTSSTGRLNKFNLKQLFSDDKLEMSPKIGKNIPSKVKFLSNQTIVLLDNQMNLHYKHQEDEWETIQSGSHGKIVAMESFENRIFNLSTDAITIFWFDEECRKLKHYKTLKIAELLDEKQTIDYLRSAHVINEDEICVCDASGLFVVANLKDEKVMRIFRVPKCFEPWSKAVAKLQNVWLIADRIGNLHLYDESTEQSTPSFKLSKVHGNIGISSMRVVDNEFVETSGVDGNVRTIKVQAQDALHTLEIYQTEKTSVNAIEKIVRWRNKEYALGFNDDFFVVYDRKNRQIVHERRCGGRHRCWDISDHDKDGKVKFAYINKKRLSIVEFSMIDVSFSGINGQQINWHVLDCNVMKRFGDILISGAEDSLMKILRIHNDSRSFEEIANIHSHISSIKDLQVFKCGDDIVILSIGGRAQIAVNRLIKRKWVKEEINFKLSKCLERPENSPFDPETRFTSLCYDVSLQIFCVACSDGFIRVFEYKKSLEPLIEHFYGRCLLQTYVLNEFILSMATDGFICFWRLAEKKLQLVGKLKHNRNGINCFDIVRHDGEYLIATGGDDNEIFITKFKICDDAVEFGETFSNNSIHIAQITGIKFLSQDKLSQEILTTSIDQTLCKCRIVNNTVELVERRFTCVADVKGLLQLSDELTIVYGAGMEIL